MPGVDAKVRRPVIAHLPIEVWGLALTNDLLHTANMQKLFRLYAPQGVTVQVFSDPDDAFRWLRQQGKQPRT